MEWRCPMCSKMNVMDEEECYNCHRSALTLVGKKQIGSRRARKIAKIIKMHFEVEDPESSVTDILTDLRHYCDARGFDYYGCDAHAYDHYSEEKGA